MDRDEKLNVSLSITPNYDSDRVARHFDDLGKREWNRLLETPVDEVSLYIHTHYLKEYVWPGARVLEIGAGAEEGSLNMGTHMIVVAEKRWMPPLQPGEAKWT